MATARRSSSSYGGFADGVIIRGMPLLTLYPGNVYWVDSNGGGGSRGTFTNPVATVSEAEALLTTDNGDIIVIKPGHAETLTATLDFDLSGFAIIGLGFGDNRPTISTGVTGAGDDLWDFAGDDVVVYNMKFADTAAGGSAVKAINCSGDNMHVENCYFLMGSEMDTVLTHDTTGKKGLQFIGNTVYGREAGPDAGLRFEKLHTNAVIAGNRWLLTQSSGIDSGCIIFMSNGNASEDGNHLIDGDYAAGLADGEPFKQETEGVQPFSLMKDCNIVGADASDNLGPTPANGFAYVRNAVVEEATGGPEANVFGGGSIYRPLVSSPAI